jgi:hypothetical protein
MRREKDEKAGRKGRRINKEQYLTNTGYGETADIELLVHG